MGTKNIHIRHIAALLILPLMAACSTQREATRPDSRIGHFKSSPATQKPYTVRGKRYEPLASHEGFEQEGLASSYGRGFHGRKTSNGERFDMRAMTAAHKTLPMGVYVKVQHKRNRREVVVRINDRGPFVQGRIIDLSTAAAEKLDMIREGLAPVKVTALGYRYQDSTGRTGYTKPESYDKGNFTLQVGAFTIRENAHRYADQLRRKYGHADVQEAVVRGEKFYRVRMGRYTSLKETQARQDYYQQNGFQGCFAVAVDR